MNLPDQVREKLLVIKKDTKENIGVSLKKILELLPDDHFLYDEFLKLSGRWQDLEKKRRSGGVLVQIVQAEKNALRDHMIEQISLAIEGQTEPHQVLEPLAGEDPEEGSPLNEKARLKAVLEELRWFKEDSSKRERQYYDLQHSIEVANNYWKLILKGSYLLVVQGTYHLLVKNDGGTIDKNVSKAIKDVVTIMFEFDFQIVVKRLGSFTNEALLVISQYIERKRKQLDDIAQELLGEELDASKLAQTIAEFCKIYKDANTEIKAWLV